MVREDIVAGLKNAVERGYSLELAKKSFISAGYSKEEVEEASAFVHGSSVIAAESKESELLQATQPTRSLPTQQQEMQKPEKEPVSNKLKRNSKIILLLVILMVLVVLLIMTLIFRDKIIGLFS